MKIGNIESKLRKLRENNHRYTYSLYLGLEIKKDTDGKYLIVVDKGKQVLSVYNRDTGKPILETLCSTGTEIPNHGYDGRTPSGLFEILRVDESSKRTWEFDTSRKPYGPYVISYYNFGKGSESCGAIHGTDEPEKLGNNVSHGCVRISNDVLKLLIKKYSRIGTPVLIRG